MSETKITTTAPASDDDVLDATHRAAQRLYGDAVSVCSLPAEFGGYFVAVYAASAKGASGGEAMRRLAAEVASQLRARASHDLAIAAQLEAAAGIAPSKHDFDTVREKAEAVAAERAACAQTCEVLAQRRLALADAPKLRGKPERRREVRCEANAFGEARDAIIARGSGGGHGR